MFKLINHNMALSYAGARKLASQAYKGRARPQHHGGIIIPVYSLSRSSPLDHERMYVHCMGASPRY